MDKRGQDGVTDGDKLPKIVPTSNVVLPTEPSGSLVTRGLEAIDARQRGLLSLNVEVDPEKLVSEAYDALKQGNPGEAVRLVLDGTEKH